MRKGRGEGERRRRVWKRRWGEGGGCGKRDEGK